MHNIWTMNPHMYSMPKGMNTSYMDHGLACDAYRFFMNDE